MRDAQGLNPSHVTTIIYYTSYFLSYQIIDINNLKIYNIYKYKHIFRMKEGLNKWIV